MSGTSEERVFLGLGSNLGDRESYLQAALDRISLLPGTRLVKASSVIETPPWGVTEQPSFLNLVAEIRTGLEPEELLKAVKEIEAEVGRQATYRWGPREIDIDLLLFGNRTVELPQLMLPHPRLRERAFVLEPLEEIAPDVLAGLP